MWAAIFAALIGIAIAVWIVSSIGHVLGLTPSGSEIGDKPDGWVSDNYEGVVVGYLLTVATIATVIALIWLAIAAHNGDPGARRLLQHGRWVAAALIVAIVVLPVGRREAPLASGTSTPVASAASDEPREEPADAPTGPLSLRVLSPSDGKRTFQSEVTVRGKATDGSHVYVGALEAELDGRRWHARVPLVRGTNRVRVRVEKSGYETATETISVTRRRKPKPKPKPAPVAEERVEPLASESTESDCDPNYSGACLKPDSPDYDCEGGSGDGPDYTGQVSVVGSDPYDLDRDGDGIACDT